MTQGHPRVAFVAKAILSTVICAALMGGCAWFDSQQPQTVQPQAMASSASVVAANTRNSGPVSNIQRGLLIETSQGIVPAQFTARALIENPSRCAKLNNYWCIKSPVGGGQWEGQIGEDNSGHARFKDPVYSARAFARTLRSYYFRRDIRSVSGIINRYAPSSDCIGSLSYCPINGSIVHQHTSIDATGRIGDKIVHYTSQKPNSSQFRRSTSCSQMLMYCPRGRNQSEEYAADVARAMNTSALSDVGLFDDLGRVHYRHMVTLMKAIAKWELGNQYSVDEALIREGLIMEVHDFRGTDPSKWPGIRESAFR